MFSEDSTGDVEPALAGWRPSDVEQALGRIGALTIASRSAASSATFPLAHPTSNQPLHRGNRVTVRSVDA